MFESKNITYLLNKQMKLYTRYTRIYIIYIYRHTDTLIYIYVYHTACFHLLQHSRPPKPLLHLSSTPHTMGTSKWCGGGLPGAPFCPTDFSRKSSPFTPRKTKTTGTPTCRWLMFFCAIRNNRFLYVRKF